MNEKPKGRTCPNCKTSYLSEHVTTCLICGHTTRPVVSVITKTKKQPIKKMEAETEDDEELIDIEAEG